MVGRFFGHHVAGTGQFRAAGGRLFSAMEGKVESTMGRKSETANLDAVKVQHATAAAEFDASKNASLHITNNSNHIAKLNEGWSAQTAAGFFERALDAAKNAIKGTWRLKEIG